MRTTSLLAALLPICVACADETGGGGGGGSGTSHVATFEFLASAGGDCVEVELADVDDSSAGEQYDCTASLLQNPGETSEVETILSACNNATMPASSTNKPCWAVIIDNMMCPTADHLRFVVEQDDIPAATTDVRIQCAAP